MKLDEGSLLSLGLTPEQASAVLEAREEEKKARACEEEKKRLYRALLQREGVDERRLDAVMRVTDFSCLRLQDGALADEEALCGDIRREWQDFIGRTYTRGQKVETPPEGGRVVMRASILAMADASERQAAIMRHPELFGI